MALSQDTLDKIIKACNPDLGLTKAEALEYLGIKESTLVANLREATKTGANVAMPPEKPDTAKRTLAYIRGFADDLHGPIQVLADEQPEEVRWFVTRMTKRRFDQLGERQDLINQYQQRIKEIDCARYEIKAERDQLKEALANIQRSTKIAIGDVPVEKEFNEALYKRIDELDLSKRSADCMKNAGIEYIWQLTERSEAEVLKTKNLGRKSLYELRELLSELGLSLGMNLPSNFPRKRT